MEEGEALGEHLNHLALPSKGAANQHEAVTDYHHLVGLDQFLEKELSQLEVALLTHLQGRESQCGEVEVALNAL